METTKNSVKCWDCGIVEDFDDDGESLECMPDGYILHNGEWVCLDCGVKRGLAPNYPEEQS